MLITNKVLTKKNEETSSLMPARFSQKITTVLFYPAKHITLEALQRWDLWPKEKVALSFSRLNAKPEIHVSRKVSNVRNTYAIGSSSMLVFQMMRNLINFSKTILGNLRSAISCTVIVDKFWSFTSIVRTLSPWNIKQIKGGKKIYVIGERFSSIIYSQTLCW